MKLLVLIFLFACASSQNLWHDFAAELNGHPQAVVEIPAGTTEKYEVNKKSNGLKIDRENGQPRLVQYLGYPANYGMIPQTYLPKELGGDGDPLDIFILGPALDRGLVYAVRIVGVMKALDRGEQDDKLIAVPLTGTFSDIQEMAELDRKYPGTTQILKIWLENYKGPGKFVVKSIEGKQQALHIFNTARAEYQKVFTK